MNDPGGAGRDGEEGAADVTGVPVQRVVRGETLHERCELAAGVGHEGEEQESVVRVVPTSQERDACRTGGGDTDVRVGGSRSRIGVS